ncbi:complement C1q-like protein 2 [Antennarius striatus]|uniref:complement C1q-like protein 2 n=1 Tax=Antennarius striatus TaxID=241820 RepID=UPI0035B17F4A
MVSGQLVYLLAVCGLVGAQIIISEGEGGSDVTQKMSSEDLVKQLMTRVENLEREHEEREKSHVAFSASLNIAEQWNTYGPFVADATLVFRRVTTNIGEAYDPSTGIFTAPRKGLYYIRYTTCVGDSGSLNTALTKNGEVMFAVFDTRGSHGSGSNGMTLVLEQGDQLSITLWREKSIFDQSRLSTFSGFLLYPM